MHRVISPSSAGWCQESMVPPPEFSVRLSELDFRAPSEAIAELVRRCRLGGSSRSDCYSRLRSTVSQGTAQSRFGDLLVASLQIDHHPNVPFRSMRPERARRSPDLPEDIENCACHSVLLVRPDVPGSAIKCIGLGSEQRARTTATSNVYAAQSGTYACARVLQAYLGVGGAWATPRTGDRRHPQRRLGPRDRNYSRALLRLPSPTRSVLRISGIE